MVELSALLLREGRLGGGGHFVLLLGQVGPENQTGNPASGKLLLTMHSLLLKTGQRKEKKRKLVSPAELHALPSGLSS